MKRILTFSNILTFLKQFARLLSICARIPRGVQSLQNIFIILLSAFYMAQASVASESDKSALSGGEKSACSTSACFREPDPCAAEKALADVCKEDIESLKKRLSPMQWTVTMENGTEPPFRNEYWDNHRAGLYLCLISGEPLFSSTDKFDSGTGWPSFTRPIAEGVVSEHVDRSHGMVRVEVRSVKGKSHLGHVFPDGPPPTRRRYCINSAALRFVPVEDFEKENLGQFRALFYEAGH